VQTTMTASTKCYLYASMSADVQHRRACRARSSPHAWWRRRGWSDASLICWW